MSNLLFIVSGGIQIATSSDIAQSGRVVTAAEAVTVCDFQDLVLKGFLLGLCHCDGEKPKQPRRRTMSFDGQCGGASLHPTSHTTHTFW